MTKKLHTGHLPRIIFDKYNLLIQEVLKDSKMTIEIKIKNCTCDSVVDLVGAAQYEFVEAIKDL